MHPITLQQCALTSHQAVGTVGHSGLSHSTHRGALSLSCWEVDLGWQAGQQYTGGEG